ncbi:MAG: hypothetical protein COA44_13930 [Arcobacter sp.]|nr:MAG: hypothetical protein COA44_13930 [Arcobacter sp.]
MIHPTQLSSQEIKKLSLKAEPYLKGLLKTVFTHNPKQKAVLVYDKNCALASILCEAYKASLPQATFINFDKEEPENILAVFAELEPFDLVVLVQSTSFRLDAFRMRVELFKKKIKVLEHPHLSRMADDELEHYVNALEYDEDYYRGLGRRLKAKVDAATLGVLDTGDEILTYKGGFETAKLNIGDYAEMVNTGGQFPIGEVFTESLDLSSLNGRMKIFCFGDVTYKVNIPEIPITLIIKDGHVIDTENSTPAFDLILSNIRRDEDGVVWVRELGFGLNRAFTKDNRVADTGSYERMCGIHVSLGKKHGIYGKPGFKRRDGRYHVDVFADTYTFKLDNEVVYKDGSWQI